jgi:hypothetical protein
MPNRFLFVCSCTQSPGKFISKEAAAALVARAPQPKLVTSGRNSDDGSLKSKGGCDDVSASILHF